MKRAFTLLESFQAVGDDLLLRGEDQTQARPRPWRRWGALAACCALVLAGIWALPHSWDAGEAETPPALRQDQESVEGQPEVESTEKGLVQDEAIQEGEDQGKHTAASQSLTLEQAREVEGLGAYLPDQPAGFYVESIRWDLEEQQLTALWCKAGRYDELRWMVRLVQEADGARVTDPEALETYDLSRYPIPRAESVPEDLREVVDCPIFLADALTWEAVQRRRDVHPDAGDSGERLCFGVLCGDVLVELSSKGVPADWVWEQLAGLGG